MGSRWWLPPTARWWAGFALPRWLATRPCTPSRSWRLALRPCGPDRPLAELIERMRDHDLTVMLVTTPEGRLLGVLPRDLAEQTFNAEGRAGSGPSMGAMETDELWGRVAARIYSTCGWWLRRSAQLGRPREGRRTWLAESVGDGGPGKVVVKASANPFVPARAAWTADAMGLLGERGYPVPPLLWRGALDEGWFVVVQARLPGQPVRTLDAVTLDRLLALVELQADQGPRLGEGDWDVSWWIGVVLFEGWEHWWDAAQAVAPQISRRLRAFLQPAWGHRLAAGDLVHGDLNLTNVLAEHGVVSGVVDWDDVGVGCRTTDLAGLLFEWYRLRLAGEAALAPDGAERLVRRIVQIAGDQGLRCVVAYGAVARLGLAAQRNQSDALQTWRHVTEAVLDFLQ
jgi:Phosphotransferase enzyme family